MTTPHVSSVEAALEFAKSNLIPKIVKLEGPKGSFEAAIVDGKPVSLKELVDEQRERPQRKRGSAQIHELGSLIAYAKRHATEHSVVFADLGASPSITVIFDAHAPGDGLPAFQRHRAEFAFPISPEFAAWRAASGKGMSQVEFAAFLEANVGDIVHPDTIGEENKRELVLRGYTAGGQTSLLSLAENLVIHENSKVRSSADLAAGKAGIIFETEHVDGGGQKVSVPKAFAIVVPPFVGGEGWEILAFLRYRHREGRITWFFDLQRVDRVLRDAVRDAAAKVAKETGLPLFHGKPE